MIRIGVLDLSGISESCLTMLSETLAKSLDIENKKNKIANAQSIFARLLLTKVYKTFKNSPIPKIIRDEKGKPRFLYDGVRVKNTAEIEPFETSEERIFFNISHDKNMVAVAVSDTQDVGIDIQSKKENMRSRKRIEKTLESFLCGVDFSGACEVSEDTELIFYKLDTSNAQLVSQMPSGERVMRSLDGALSEADASFLCSWTRLESLLKLSGGGFADSGEVRDTALSAKVQSFFINDENGEIYSLTLSHY